MQIETNRGLKRTNEVFLLSVRRLGKLCASGSLWLKTDLSPKSPRAHAKLRTKGPIKIRYIAEAAIESDIENLRRLRCEAHGSFTQARPQNVLMRRQACQAFKRTQKVIRAQPCFSRQASDSEPGISMPLDHSHASCHPSHCTRWSVVRVGEMIVTLRELYRPRRQVQAKLLPRYVTSIQAGACPRHQRRQHTQRRQAKRAEVRASAAASGIGHETLEIIGGVGKRKTAVSRAVSMARLETLYGLAQQKPTWCHQLAPRTESGLASVLKARRQHDDDGNA